MISVFGGLKKKLKEAVKKVSKSAKDEDEPKEDVKEIEEPQPTESLEAEVSAPIGETVAEEAEEQRLEKRAEEIAPEPFVEEAEKEIEKQLEPEPPAKVKEPKTKPKTKPEPVKKKPEKKPGLLGRIRKKTLNEDDIEKIMGELQLILLENDVSMEVAERISADVREELLNTTVKRGQVEEAIKTALRRAMIDVMDQGKIDLEKEIESSDVYTIAFLGFNGTGKCVTGDTMIQLSDGRTVPIEDMYSKYNKIYSEEETDDGYIIEIKDDVRAITTDLETLKTVSSPVTHIWKLKKDRILEVTLTNGHKIQVTPEHPFFILEDGKIDTRTAGRLRESDYVMVPKNIQTDETPGPSALELLEFIKHPKLFLQSERFVKKLYGLIRKDYKTWKEAWKDLEPGVSEVTFSHGWSRDMQVPTTFALRMCQKYPELTKFVDSAVLTFSGSNISIKLRKLDKNFYKFAGLFYGEGYLYKNYIQFTNTDDELVEAFKESVKKTFGIEKFSEKSDKRNPRVKTVTVSSKTVYHLVSKLLGIPEKKKKNRHMKIPSLLLQTKDKNLAEMLKWYWECDGSIEKNHRVLEAVTGSKVFAEQISMILLRFGIIPSMREKIVDDVPFYRVIIAGKQKILDFYGKIGVVTKKRLKRILNLVNMNSQFEVTELLPNQSESIKSLRITNKMTQIDVASVLGVQNSLICQYESSKYGVSVPAERVQKMCSNFDSEDKFLEKLSNADVRWIGVESVDEIDSEDKWVYDLTVKNTHNFVAGNLIIHNTTTLAKFAHRFKDYKPILAAGDTFRAASIEQLEEHGQKLGAKVIKHKYGSDAAAVIFDAKKHAAAKGHKLVLADTAGRSHSNANLMDELKKVIRVNEPDLKVLVLDSVTGNDIYEQSRLFHEAVGVDAIVLTKADVYEKGGAALSAAYTIKKPIMFLGTGQEYKDLVEFDPEKIANELLE